MTVDYIPHHTSPSYFHVIRTQMASKSPQWHHYESPHTPTNAKEVWGFIWDMLCSHISIKQKLTQESIPDFQSHYMDITVSCSFIQSNNTHIGRACSDEYIYLVHVFHMPDTTLDVLCGGVPGTTSLDSAVVILAAVLLQQKETEHNQERKRCVCGGGKSGGNQSRHPGSSQCSHTKCTSFASIGLWTLSNVAQQGHLLEVQCPELLLDLDYPRIPEGKQMLSTNHHVCTNRQGIVPHSFGNGWNPPQIQGPRCQPRANLLCCPFKGQQSGLQCSLFPACLFSLSWCTQWQEGRW